ncbi:MAG: adenylate/guanylate cyclase domain-containing protein [Allopontixanthobacter sediminis]
MSARGTGSFIKRGWRNVREAGSQRLALTAVLLLAALLLARFSWSLPGIADAEGYLFDGRSYDTAEQVEQDQRILMVVYTDQTLMNLQKRSPLDRGLLAEALRNLDSMDAKAIGIDILFDQPQQEDAELIETLRAMQTPVSVAYAAMATNEDDIIFEQQQYLENFLGQLEGSNARPASIRLDNTSGVTRIWPSIEPGLPPVLGRTMLTDAGEGDRIMPGYTGAIRYRLPAVEGAPVITSLPIDLFADPEMVPLMAEQAAGKYVLIGGDLLDFDRVDTTFSATGDEGLTQSTVPGLQVHAEMIAQMLDGRELPKPAPVILWLLAGFVVLAATLSALLEWRDWKVYPLLGAQFALFLGLPYLLQANGVDTYGFPAFGLVVGWIIAFTAVTSAARASGAVQRNFAQGALGKYLPREMAQEIIENPELLALHGEKKSIYVLFSDLEGFTKMSHAMEPEMVAKLLNRYLEMLSQVVLDHGGVIDKFVGDAVVAFWGAPIAKPGDGERAARAGYAIWQAGEAFRAEVAAMDTKLPKIGKTRVGLHYGEAVVGNFGGRSRIQYTALGDSMNTAARLEAANKALESSVMASREFADRTPLDWWRPMGRITLRGRAQPVNIMEPAPDFPEDDRKVLIQAMILADSGGAEAEILVRQLISRHPDDKALGNLLYRLQNLSGGNTYVLG